MLTFRGVWESSDHRKGDQKAKLLGLNLKTANRSLGKAKVGRRRPDGWRSSQGRVRPVCGVRGTCWPAVRGFQWRGGGYPTSQLSLGFYVHDGRAVVGGAQDSNDLSSEVKAEEVHAMISSGVARKQCSSKVGRHAHMIVAGSTGGS